MVHLAAVIKTHHVFVLYSAFALPSTAWPFPAPGWTCRQTLHTTSCSLGIDGSSAFESYAQSPFGNEIVPHNGHHPGIACSPLLSLSCLVSGCLGWALAAKEGGSVAPLRPAHLFLYGTPGALAPSSSGAGLRAGEKEAECCASSSPGPLLWAVPS